MEGFTTTSEVATDLGIEEKEIRRLMDKYPIEKPLKFGREFAWTAADVEGLSKWSGYDKHGICPYCTAKIETRKVFRKKKAAATPPAETTEGGEE